MPDGLGNVIGSPVTVCVRLPGPARLRFLAFAFLPEPLRFLFAARFEFAEFELPFFELEFFVFAMRGAELEGCFQHFAGDPVIGEAFADDEDGIDGALPEGDGLAVDAIFAAGAAVREFLGDEIVERVAFAETFFEGRGR